MLAHLKSEIKEKCEIEESKEGGDDRIEEEYDRVEKKKMTEKRKKMTKRRRKVCFIRILQAHNVCV